MMPTRSVESIDANDAELPALLTLAHVTGDERAHLAITLPHFPILFLLYGPNTNIVVNGSIIFFTECEVRTTSSSERSMGSAQRHDRTDRHSFPASWNLEGVWTTDASECHNVRADRPPRRRGHQEST